MGKQKISREQYGFELSDFLIPIVGGKRYALRNPESPDNPELERKRWTRTSLMVFYHVAYIAGIAATAFYAVKGLAKLLK